MRYGDLSEQRADRDDEHRNALSVGSAAGCSGVATSYTMMRLVGARTVRFGMTGHGRSCQRGWRKRRQGGCACRGTDAHGIAGGPRMFGVRAKVSMMIIGAPQCRHTKVGCAQCVPGAAAMRSAVSCGAG
jgi:hypothetical protein